MPVLAMADGRLSKDAAWAVAVQIQECEKQLETQVQRLAELKALPPPPPEQQIREELRRIRATRCMMAALWGESRLAVDTAIGLEDDEEMGASVDFCEEMMRRTDQSNELRIAAEQRAADLERRFKELELEARDYLPRMRVQQVVKRAYISPRFDFQLTTGDMEELQQQLGRHAPSPRSFLSSSTCMVWSCLPLAALCAAPAPGCTPPPPSPPPAPRSTRAHVCRRARRRGVTSSRLRPASASAPAPTSTRLFGSFALGAFVLGPSCA